MDKFTREELDDALQIVSSVISRCEKTQPKFVEGTSQYTLLKNRIEALRPVSSIIGKCEKAQLKFEEGTPFRGETVCG